MGRRTWDRTLRGGKERRGGGGGRDGVVEGKGGGGGCKAVGWKEGKRERYREIDEERNRER